MKTNTPLKIVTIIACSITILTMLYANSSYRKYQRLFDVEAECELLKSELNKMLETQNTIAEVKKEYIKSSGEQNNNLDSGLQNRLEADIKFEDTYNDLVSGLNYMTECAYDYYSNSMGDGKIGFYNWSSRNNISLIKLRVVAYEALSYKDKSYIPLYKEALEELINKNKNTYYD